MSDDVPVLRVVRGAPTAEELAAVVVVLAAASAASTVSSDPQPVRRWASPAARLRTAYGPSRGGWRASALPR